MIILSIIRALLEENTVTITGFGTFCVKKLPAQIKEDIVFPPQNIIEFEYAEYAEDFDFISKLSKWEQIKIDEAQVEVSQWIDLLKKGLEHNPTIFFDDFGTFSKNIFGKIVFQSAINPQLNIENEGYEPVIVSTKMQEEKRNSINEPVQDKRTIPVIDKKKKRDKIYFWIVIFVTVVVLSTLFFKDTLYHLYQTIFEKIEILMTVDDNKIDNPTDIYDITEKVVDDTATIENNKIETVENNIPVSNKLELNENGSPKKSITVKSKKDMYLHFQEGKYYVIVGSFLKEENALRYIEEENIEKYHPKLIVHPNNPRIRVAIGVFDNELDAVSYAEQIKKNYWILK